MIEAVDAWCDIKPDPGERNFSFSLPSEYRLLGHEVWDDASETLVAESLASEFSEQDLPSRYSNLNEIAQDDPIADLKVEANRLKDVSSETRMNEVVSEALRRGQLESYDRNMGTCSDFEKTSEPVALVVARLARDLTRRIASSFGLRAIPVIRVSSSQRNGRAQSIQEHSQKEKSPAWSERGRQKVGQIDSEIGILDCEFALAFVPCISIQHAQKSIMVEPYGQIAEKNAHMPVMRRLTLNDKFQHKVTHTLFMNWMAWQCEFAARPWKFTTQQSLKSYISNRVRTDYSSTRHASSHSNSSHEFNENACSRRCNGLIHNLSGCVRVKNSVEKSNFLLMDPPEDNHDSVDRNIPDNDLENLPGYIMDSSFVDHKNVIIAPEDTAESFHKMDSTILRKDSSHEICVGEFIPKADQFDRKLQEQDNDEDESAHPEQKVSNGAAHSEMRLSLEIPGYTSNSSFPFQENASHACLRNVILSHVEACIPENMDLSFSVKETKIADVYPSLIVRVPMDTSSVYSSTGVETWKCLRPLFLPRNSFTESSWRAEFVRRISILVQVAEGVSSAHHRGVAYASPLHISVLERVFSTARPHECVMLPPLRPLSLGGNISSYTISEESNFCALYQHVFSSSCPPPELCTTDRDLLRFASKVNRCDDEPAASEAISNPLSPSLSFHSSEGDSCYLDANSFSSMRLRVEKERENRGNFRIDHRVDIFSFGVFAYSVLTGRLPFPCLNDFASVKEYILSLDCAHPFDIDLPKEEVIDLVMKGISQCLQPSPSGRMDSLDQLVAVLKDAIAACNTASLEQSKALDRCRESLLLLIRRQPFDASAGERESRSNFIPSPGYPFISQFPIPLLSEKFCTQFDDLITSSTAGVKFIAAPNSLLGSTLFSSCAQVLAIRHDISTEVVSLGKADRSDVVIAGKISNAVQSLSVRIRLRCEDRTPHSTILNAFDQLSGFLAFPAYSISADRFDHDIDISSANSCLTCSESVGGEHLFQHLQFGSLAQDRFLTVVTQSLVDIRDSYQTIFHFSLENSFPCKSIKGSSLLPLLHASISNSARRISEISTDDQSFSNFSIFVGVPNSSEEADARFPNLTLEELLLFLTHCFELDSPNAEELGNMLFMQTKGSPIFLEASINRLRELGALLYDHQDRKWKYSPPDLKIAFFSVMESDFFYNLLSSLGSYEKTILCCVSLFGSCCSGEDIYQTLETSLSSVQFAVIHLVGLGILQLEPTTTGQFSNSLISFSHASFENAARLLPQNEFLYDTVMTRLAFLLKSSQSKCTSEEMRKLSLSYERVPEVSISTDWIDAEEDQNDDESSLNLLLLLRQSLRRIPEWNPHGPSFFLYSLSSLNHYFSCTESGTVNFASKYDLYENALVRLMEFAVHAVLLRSFSSAEEFLNLLYSMIELLPAGADHYYAWKQTESWMRMQLFAAQETCGFVVERFKEDFSVSPKLTSFDSNVFSAFHNIRRSVTQRDTEKLFHQLEEFFHTVLCIQVASPWTISDEWTHEVLHDLISEMCSKRNSPSFVECLRPPSDRDLSNQTLVGRTIDQILFQLASVLVEEYNSFLGRWILGFLVMRVEDHGYSDYFLPISSYFVWHVLCGLFDDYDAAAKYAMRFRGIFSSNSMISLHPESSFLFFSQIAPCILDWKFCISKLHGPVMKTALLSGNKKVVDGCLAHSLPLLWFSATDFRSYAEEYDRICSNVLNIGDELPLSLTLLSSYSYPGLIQDDVVFVWLSSFDRENSELRIAGSPLDPNLFTPPPEHDMKQDDTIFSSYARRLVIAHVLHILGFHREAWNQIGCDSGFQILALKSIALRTIYSALFVSILSALCDMEWNPRHVSGNEEDTHSETSLQSCETFLLNRFSLFSDPDAGSGKNYKYKDIITNNVKEAEHCCQFLQRLRHILLDTESDMDGFSVADEESYSLNQLAPVESHLLHQYRMSALSFAAANRCGIPGFGESLLSAWYIASRAELTKLIAITSIRRDSFNTHCSIPEMLSEDKRTSVISEFVAAEGEAELMGNLLLHGLLLESRGRFLVLWSSFNEIAGSIFQKSLELYGEFGSYNKVVIGLSRYEQYILLHFEANHTDMGMKLSNSGIISRYDHSTSPDGDSLSGMVTSLIQELTEAASSTQDLAVRLLTLSRDHIGAERAYFIVNREAGGRGMMRIEAKIDPLQRTSNRKSRKKGQSSRTNSATSKSNHLVKDGVVIEPRDLDRSVEEICLAIILFVAHMFTPVVLGNATSEGAFTNVQYIERFRPKSVLCYPIRRNSDRSLLALLYLENNKRLNAFNHERVALCEGISRVLGGLLSHAMETDSMKSDYHTLLRKYEISRAFCPESFIRSMANKTVDRVSTGRRKDQKMTMLRILTLHPSLISSSYSAVMKSFDRNQPVLPGEALGYSGTSNSRRGSVAAESVESGEVSDYAESVHKHLSFLFSMVEGFGGVVWKATRDFVDALFFTENCGTAVLAALSIVFSQEMSMINTCCAIHQDSFALTLAGVPTSRLEVVFLSENSRAVEYLTQVASAFGSRIVCTESVLKSCNERGIPLFDRWIGCVGLGGRLRVHEVIGIDYASCIPSKLISADQILAVKELEENSEVVGERTGQEKLVYREIFEEAIALIESPYPDTLRALKILRDLSELFPGDSAISAVEDRVHRMKEGDPFLLPSFGPHDILSKDLPVSGLSEIRIFEPYRTGSTARYTRSSGSLHIGDSLVSDPNHQQELVQENARSIRRDSYWDNHGESLKGIECFGHSGSHLHDNLSLTHEVSANCMRHSLQQDPVLLVDAHHGTSGLVGQQEEQDMSLFSSKKTPIEAPGVPEKSEFDSTHRALLYSIRDEPRRHSLSSTRSSSHHSISKKIETMKKSCCIVL